MKSVLEAVKTVLSIVAIVAVTGAFLSGATALTPKWPGFGGTVTAGYPVVTHMTRD